VRAARGEPRVTFGLPVYNGQRYLRQALDSILAQSYTDFEVVVCDNASTDDTSAICAEYGRRDTRIRYHRNEVNIGGSRNYNRVVELARGPYFASGGHDDVWAPTWLERCVQVLDDQPHVVLAFAIERPIDAEGRRLPRKPFDLRVDAERPSVRFRDLIQLEHGIDTYAGLVRTDVLRRTPLEGQFADADRVLYAELALHGRFHQVPEELFFRRDHPEQSAKKYASRQERTAWFDPTGTGKIVFPHPRELLEMVRAVRRVPLPRRERLACYAAIGGWARRYHRRLRYDVVNGLKDAVRPLFVRVAPSTE
jgi:glycosyltransferase involved in cell wall biosynthesis